ncbi:hypothetical protein [Streptomyces sp. NPDC059894]|uniref:hypothetical protein n=1 Tax=unclassified Streptomyces TaxID=2593676 RepID=UPI003658170A
MYLIHVCLRHPDGSPLPRYMAEAMARAATGIAAVVHVAVHTEAWPHPTIGVYLRASTLEAAERSAQEIWYAAQATYPCLRDWVLVRAEAPLMPSIEL